MSVIPADIANCTWKVRYMWHWQAQDAADRHISCTRCSEGSVMHAYRCRSDPSHWHIGHGEVPA